MIGDVNIDLNKIMNRDSINPRESYIKNIINNSNLVVYSP